MSGGPPIGYENCAVDGRATIRPSADAHFIIDAFESVAQNTVPVETIRSRLYKQGLSGITGRPLQKSYFYRMLGNKLYTGWIYKFKEQHKGLFEPLISEALFQKVQYVLGRIKKYRTHSYLTDHPDFPLRRFCRNMSGRGFSGSWCKGRNKRYAYYWSEQDKPGRERTSIRKEKLEQAFIVFLNSFSLPPFEWRQFTSWLTDIFEEAHRNQQQIIDAVCEKIDLLKQEQEVLIQKNLDGILSNNQIDDALARRKDKIMEHQYVLQSIDAWKTNPKRLLERLQVFFSDIGGIWSILSIKEQKRIQWVLFPSGIVYDRDHMQAKTLATLLSTRSLFMHLTRPTTFSPDVLLEIIHDCQAILAIEGIAQLTPSLLEN